VLEATIGALKIEAPKIEARNKKWDSGIDEK
jgi:hypothetical protein